MDHLAGSVAGWSGRGARQPSQIPGLSAGSGQVPAVPAEPAGLRLRHRGRGLLQCTGDPLLCAGGAGGLCGVVLVGRVRWLPV